MIRDLDGKVQAFRERRRRLLRAALVARVDRVDTGDDIDVLQEIGEQLGALPAAGVQRRIVVARHRDVGIGVAHEDHRRAGALLRRNTRDRARRWCSR